MNEPNPLLEALDELTKERRTKVIQDTTTGHKVETVTLPALLEQLDEAISSSIGGSSRGASLAFEGAVLNTAALFTAMKISSQIGDWCRMVKVKPTKNSTADLRAWYAARQATNPDSDDWYTRQLTGWARQIEALLDPPRERDLPDACPLCGATEWWDMKTGTRYMRPLIVRYRPSDADMIQQATGLCRACEQVWTVRQLAYDLETRHANEGDAESA